MLNSQQNKFFSSFTRLSRSKSVASGEQTQVNDRLQRIFLSIFAENANSFTNLHRSCLGDVDTYPQLKISQEERKSLEGNIISKYKGIESTIIKDALHRNLQIKNSLFNYQKYVKTACQGIQKQKNNIKTVELQSEKRKQNGINQKKQVIIINLPPRRQRYRDEANFEKKHNQNLFYQTLNTNLFSQINKLTAKSFHVKSNLETLRQKDTKSIKLAKVHSRAKKSTTHKAQYSHISSDKQRSYQEILSFGEEGFICKGRIQQGSINYSLNKTKSVYERKCSVKQMTKSSEKKSLDGIQRMKIQNKMNITSFSINITKHHGYLPKSRCLRKCLQLNQTLQ